MLGFKKCSVNNWKKVKSFTKNKIKTNKKEYLKQLIEFFFVFLNFHLNYNKVLLIL